MAGSSYLFGKYHENLLLPSWDHAAVQTRRFLPQRECLPRRLLGRGSVEEVSERSHLSSVEEGDRLRLAKLGQRLRLHELGDQPLRPVRQVETVEHHVLSEGGDFG